MILVTDAMPPARGDFYHELPITNFSIVAARLCVKGSSCFAPDGRLAGTALTMNKAVGNIVESTSTNLSDAVKMANLNPAKLLGIDQAKSSLEASKDGDAVVADAELNIHATVVGGAIVHQL